ncbi:UDP-N-acetylglucosamine 1-carboxyvinyltransferase [Helicobacter monodelphidis]|uniref:UDP-N-acetylglucosamine 1-carboxyvinyltransferase n=1 Tax=Helicobacter sp. 15-1451 TaxID=2004995 RepID=UPI000DCB564D|nr:UDP-N-acetylglucosamine 1-carboxyvinyltransferase [Helicobacter sp. 15-1451]RAX58394.1 UDP-N-acetylglucosamine 1-carboxyvinyltransferase [Helicobacter sp. 15-1451]
MDFLCIQGGGRLSGEVHISGSKNAALPLLGVTLLGKNDIHIHNLPQVVDIQTFITLLNMLGAKTHFEAGNACINTTSVNQTKAVYDIVRKMRASILVLGPLLARFGHCEVSLPGGCAIGARPVDLHLKALEKMGATIHIESGYIIAKAPQGLKAAEIEFEKITVTGTENIVMAAALARGKTRILNAAREPEVVQLCEVLQESGVQIEGIGSNELIIEGSDRELLNIPSFNVIPDRIEAGTYLCAAAITQSAITLKNICTEHLKAIILKLKEAGFTLYVQEDTISIESLSSIQPFEIITTEYPGFPTDVQAQFMALATQAEGESKIIERLFENRFMHVNELQRMGAKITLDGNCANVHGKTHLLGADVMATDLRASSALVLAALSAKGETRIHRIYHLDRGYEQLEEKLTQLGAKVYRGRE